MIIKGRSPTMRHVSRTQRVALDWLLDGIHLDPTIQGKYVDTRSQLVDILTKGTFTRDGWNHLLQFFLTQWTLPFSLAVISAFELTSAQPCQCDRCRVNRREKMTNRVVAMWRTVRNLVAFAPTRSLPQSSSVPTSPCLERPRACCQSSDPPSLGKPRAAVLSADDTRHSQVMQVERNEQRSLERPGAPKVGKYIWHLTTFPIRKRTGYLESSQEFAPNLRCA